MHLVQVEKLFDELKSAQEKIEVLNAGNMDLEVQLDERHWAEERRTLLQALEEEKEKVLVRSLKSHLSPNWNFVDSKNTKCRN